MNKEFELWWCDNKDELRRSFRDDLSDAFAAGRALGRREVKGEAGQIAGLSACEECVTGVVRDIEAIPEEG